MNIEQKKAAQLITDFISKKEKGFFGLLGAGGTGKTYLVTHLEGAENFQYLGPTNKACNVLRKSLVDQAIFKPKVQTIDSYFNFKMLKDENNKTVYEHSQPPLSKIADVIVVDEVSLLSDMHVKLLKNLPKQIPIIMIGDDKQIPPVNGSNRIDGFLRSTAFNVLDESYELTIQNRQSENSKLFKFISGFRNNMQRELNFTEKALKYQNKLDIMFLDQDSEEFLKTIKKDFVAIAYKNNTADLLNYKIGKQITGSEKYNIRSVNEGDYLIFDKFYKNEKTVFFTSDKIQIDSIFKKVETLNIPYYEKPFEYSFKKASVISEDGTFYTIYLTDSKLREKVYSRVYNLRKRLTDKKQLSQLNTFYHNFLNSTAKLKKPNAMTAHKSQGSTFENVIVPVYDFQSKIFKDANQLFYVAISRASKRIIFVKGKCNFQKTWWRVNFTQEERKLICDMQNWKCNICNKEINDREYDIDHIKRLGQKNKFNNIEGNNTISNLQALCKNCHKIKTKNDR